MSVVIIIIVDACYPAILVLGTYFLFDYLHVHLFPLNQSVVTGNGGEINKIKAVSAVAILIGGEAPTIGLAVANGMHVERWSPGGTLRIEKKRKEME